jgi:hypothetical protein
MQSRREVEANRERVQRDRFTRVFIGELAFLMVAGLVALAVLVLMSGCEGRTFVREEIIDGVPVRTSYSRWTLMGESSSEGVSVAKDGDDFTVDVGPTGSKTDAQIAIEAFGIGVGVGREQAGE